MKLNLGTEDENMIRKLADERNMSVETFLVWLVNAHDQESHVSFSTGAHGFVRHKCNRIGCFEKMEIPKDRRD